MSMSENGKSGMDVARGFPGVGHGDRVHVTFKEPIRHEGRDWIEVTGVTTIIVGLLYVAVEGVSRPLGMPSLMEVFPDEVASIEVLETSVSIQERAKARVRGDLVYAGPGATGAEIRRQLETLAGMIVELDMMNPRHRQLMHQFADIADHVELAETKRTYLLTKAKLAAKLGWRDFNPWATKTDDVYRIKTVRPIASDFEPDRARRRDRRRRLEEAIMTFGEGERETRALLSHLRAAGYDARRTHPNGFEVAVRFRLGERRSFDAIVRCSDNGLWEASLPLGNKREMMMREQISRRGLFAELTAVVAGWDAGGRTHKATKEAA